MRRLRVKRYINVTQQLWSLGLIGNDLDMGGLSLSLGHLCVSKHGSVRFCPNGNLVL